MPDALANKVSFGTGFGWGTVSSGQRRFFSGASYPAEDSRQLG